MRKKIEFLDRLFAVLNCRFEILQFLKDENVISDDIMQNLLNEHHGTHSSRIASLLHELQVGEQLSLVDYEWSILPSELLKLTIVAPTAKREFTYSV